MQSINEDYFSTLIEQFKKGNINPHSMLQEVEHSSLSSHDSDNFGLSEINGNLPVPLASRNTLNALFSKQSLTPESKPLSSRLHKAHNVTAVSISEACDNRTARQTASPDDKENARSDNIITSNPNGSRIIDEMRSQNRIGLKNKASAATIGTERSLSATKRGKRQYSTEKIQEIRESSAQMREQKRMAQKIERYLTEEQEFESQCVFKPQLNDSKNKKVRSRYLETKQLSAQPDISEPCSFKPTVRDYSTSPKASEHIVNYLQVDRFKRLAVHQPYAHNPLVGEDKVLTIESLPQPERESEPPVNDNCDDDVNTEPYESDEGGQLVKQYMIGKIMPGGHIRGCIDMEEQEQDQSLIACMREVSQPESEAKQEDMSSYEDLEKEFERLMKEGESQLHLSDLAISRQEDYGSDDMYALASADFHSRQEAYERIKRKRHQELLEKSTPSGRPELSQRTKRIVNKDPTMSDFMARSKHFEDRKRDKIVKKQQEQEQQSVFKPKITRIAGDVKASSIDSLVYEHSKQKEAKLFKLRKEKAQKELEEVVLYPEINRKIEVQSKLGLRTNHTDYVKKLREKEEVQKEFKSRLDKRKQIQETIECTHRPQINSTPTYLKHSKPQRSTCPPAKHSYSQMHRKKTPKDKLEPGICLFDASVIHNVVEPSQDQTLQLAVDDLWNTEGGGLDQSGKETAIERQSLGLTAESLRDLIQVKHELCQDAETPASSSLDKHVLQPQTKHPRQDSFALIEEKNESEEQTIRKSDHTNDSKATPEQKETSSLPEGVRQSLLYIRESIHGTNDDSYTRSNYDLPRRM